MNPRPADKISMHHWELGYVMYLVVDEMEVLRHRE
jgi:hypothetical protein